MIPPPQSAQEFMKKWFPKKMNSVQQKLAYKLKALKILGCYVGLWGPFTVNPYMSGKLPLEKQTILELFWAIHADNLQKHQYAALSTLLDYYFPIWRGFATDEVLGSGIERGDGAVRSWRNEVLKRDGHKCAECGSENNLQAHHIYEWSEYPALRIDVDNGITLCGNCHHKEHPHMGEKIFTKNLNNN